MVGGGIAGLSAAWRLKKAGIDVTVLEARDTPGGRISSVNFEGTWIDRGAESFGSIEVQLMKAVSEIGLDDVMHTVYDGPGAGSVRSARWVARRSGMEAGWSISRL